MGWFIPAAIGAGVGFAASKMGDKGSVETKPTTSASQQALEKAISEYLQKNVGKGAAPYGGDLTAPVPEEFGAAYEQFMGGMGRTDIASATRDLIAGVPAYAYKPGVTAKTWRETYAAPIMESWRATVLPMLEEQYNIPGGFYSTEKGKGVARAASEFYSGQVAPSLWQAQQADVQRGFESGEAAAGRRQAATAMPFEQFTRYATAAQMKQAQLQTPLTAAYQEYLRTRAEPGWAVSAGMGQSTAQTQENIAFQGSNPLGDIAAMGMSAAMLFGGGGGQTIGQAMTALENPWAYE